MSEWATDDGRVDVSVVMNRIREKIRGRRDLGLYSDEEVEELSALKLQAFADDAGIDPTTTTGTSRPTTGSRPIARASARARS